MLKFLRKIDIPFKTYSLISIGLGIITILTAFIIRGRHLPPLVPLFYGLAQGEEQLTNSSFLSLPIFLSLLILVINCTVALLVKDVFLKKVLVLSGIAAIVFSLITVGRIVLLVGSF